MNELDNLPSISKEDARCWGCGAIEYSAGNYDEELFKEKGFFKIINCTNCQKEQASAPESGKE